MIRVLVACAALVLALGDASAQAGPLGEAGGRLRAAVAAARTPEATVALAQGDEVYLDKGRADGLRRGARLVLERPGGEIRHPETGEVIGAARSRVGRLEVTWTDERYARARVLEREPGEAPALRDVARPEGPTRVALLGLAHADGRATRLAARLDDAVAEALAGLDGVVVEAAGAPAPRGPADAAAAAAAARAVGADLAVGGRIDGDRLVLVLVEAADGRLRSTLEAAVPADLAPLGEEVVATAPTPASAPAAAPRPAEPGRRGALERIEYHEGGEVTLPFPVDAPLDACLADLDGDGRDEIVATDQSRLLVYRLEEGGADGAEARLVEVAREDGGFAATFLFLSAADLDGDGRDEILATEKPGNFVRAMVYRWDGNRLHRLWRESGRILRAVRVQGEDRVYGQSLGYHKVFEGPVVRLRWNGQAFDEEASGLSPKVTLFDFAPIEPLGLVASVDFEHRVRLYDAGGAVLWKSTEEYGRSDVELSARAPNVVEEVRRGLLPFDVDGDGLDEAIAVQNVRKGIIGGWLAFGQRSRFSSGRLVALARESHGLVERWKTRDFQGGIRGFSIGDVRGRGPEAVFLTVSGGETLGFGDRMTHLHVVPLREGS